jgi:HemY protein
VLLVLVLAVALVTLVLAGFWQRFSPGALRRRVRGPVARRRLKLGFRALTEARYDKAERLFRAAASGDWPLAAWLGAARAAARAGREEGAREHLDRARGCDGGELPAELFLARLDRDQGETARARQRLSELGERYPDHPERLQLLCEVLERQQDWPALRELLPRLKDETDAERARLQRRLWLALLRQTGEEAVADPAEHRNAVVALWKQVPGFLQRDPSLLARYTGYLAQSGDGREALRLVRKALERDWDDRLPPVLEAIEDVPPETLLQHLETWLQERAGNGPLLITAGRVALRAGLWGKARSFFRAAVSSSSAEIAYEELARLLDALGEADEARRCRDEAMARAARSLPSLPLPAAGERE